MAGCGWTTVAVGSQLGYSGYPANPPECTRPAEAPFIAGLAASRFVPSAGRAEHGGMVDSAVPGLWPPGHRGDCSLDRRLAAGGSKETR